MVIFHLVYEYLLDPHLEEIRHLKGQTEGWVIALVFDRIDRCAGHTQLSRQLLLRKVMHSPVDLQPVFHYLFRSRISRQAK
jgi:hypothetical protein